MAVDFADTGVSTVSIWMGILLTEKLEAAFAGTPTPSPRPAEHAETLELDRVSDRRAVPGSWSWAQLSAGALP